MKLVRMVYNPGAIIGLPLYSDCECDCHEEGYTCMFPCCEQHKKYDIPFPELDEYSTPKQKLPNCPNCEEDELGVITERYMKCYNCGWGMELVEKV